MNTQFSLFPETLLVEVSNGKVYTTSLKVAEHFGKSHKNVLRDIRRIIEQSSFYDERELRLNFEPQLSNVIVGKKVYELEFFHLSHDGFAILTQGFTGEKAMRWKWEFLRAFREKEHQLAARDRRYTRAFAKRHPYTITVAEMSQKGMNRAVIGKAINKSPASVTYYRCQARGLGLLN